MQELTGRERLILDLWPLRKIYHLFSQSWLADSDGSDCKKKKEKETENQNQNKKPKPKNFQRKYFWSLK